MIKKWVMSAWFVLIFGGVSLLAQAEPRLVEPVKIRVEQAAEYIGKTVVFEAEVEGVSKSPRSGLVYLNFGAAYPRQILSVKIPKENADIQANMRGAFGAMVRVVGIPLETKEGPVITVTDEARISFIESSPGKVLEEQGESRTYRNRLGTVLGRMFQQKDYAGLEALAAKWRNEKTRMNDGSWLLTLFYNNLDRHAGDGVGIVAQIAALEAWRKERPLAIEPVIASAELLVSFAWAARGTGYADTVTAEGGRLMNERLALARTTLDLLGGRFSECPRAAAVMQRIALGQGWSHAEYAALHNEATSREPEYLEYYFAASFRLLTRWYGEPGEWEEYSRHAAPGDFGVELASRIPWSLTGYSHNIFRETAVRWENMRDGFEVMVRRFPDSVRNRSAYALFAGMAEDRTTCLRLLDELGDKLDMSLWVNWTNVDLARRWIADPSQPAPRIFKLYPKEEPEEAVEKL